MKVTFTDVDEFLKELIADSESGKVDRNIVRRTYSYIRSEPLPLNRKEEIIAGYSVEGQLVELKTFTGYITEFDNNNEQRLKRGAEIMNKIEFTCNATGMSLRAGRLQE